MKRLMVFGLLLWLACSLFPLTAAATLTHDARYLDLKIAYTLNQDGSWDREVHQRVRLDTYYAINRALGETFIVINPVFQNLEILKSETTMADGRKVVTPENAFNEILPYPVHGFADFAALREMVVTHTGLERGAVVELHYRLHTKPGFFPVFSGCEELSQRFPIDSYQLTINIPDTQELNLRLFGLDASVSGTQNAAVKSYVINLKNLLPAVREPLKHPQAEPFVVFTIASDWKQAFALERDDTPLPPVLSKRIGVLKAKGGTRSELLVALQKISADEIKNCPLGIGETGWLPRCNERIAMSNYGTRLEKALLLGAMLREAGIDSELLAVAGDAFAPKVPTALQIKSFWLKVVDDSGAFYLDPWQPQNGFFPFAVHGLNAWNIGRQELEKLPSVDSKMNGVDISGRISIGANGVCGALRVEARGCFHHYDEATENGQTVVEGLLRKFFQVEKAEIRKVLLLTRGKMQAEVEFTGKWLQANGNEAKATQKGDYFTVPFIHLPMLSEEMVQPVRRQSPMLLEAPFEVSLKLELQPEEGLRLEYRPVDVKMENDFGAFSRILTQTEAGALQVSIGCRISRSLLSPEDYPLLRQVLLPYFTPGPWLLFRKE